ncbi:MAG TPA: tetratricopeptide repeat protein [Methylomirabilota bacterium]|jgi:tetratricopeptide (TPR) repeat protein
MKGNAFAVLALAVIAVAPGCRTAATPLEQGMAYYDKGAWGAAVAAFDEAIQRDPLSESAYANRGAARLHLGDAQGAVEDFTRALEMKPSDPAVLFFNRGNAYALAGNTVGAISDFTRAVEIRPDFARSFFNRGLVRARTGDLQGARVDWRQAIAIEPDVRVREAMTRHAEQASVPPAAVEGAPRVAPAADGPSETSAAGPSPESAIPATAAPSAADQATAAPAAPPAGPASTAPPEPIDAKALANRGINRELAGDHDGALADLRSALQIETDPSRRVGIENLLKLLEPKR